MGDHHRLTQLKSLVFDKEIDTKKSYLLRADSEFLKQFESCSELTIRGSSTEEPILNFAQSCYRLKHINLTTHSLVINEKGVILQQTSSYLDLQLFNPSFNEIYATILKGSCQLPDKQGVNDYTQLISNYSFSATGLKQKCFLSDADFTRLTKAMKMISIQHNNETIVLYVGVHLSVSIMRQIIKTFNGANKHLLQEMSKSSLVHAVPLMNHNILEHIINEFEFVASPQDPQVQGTIRMSASSILKYIFSEMVLAKKQYSFSTFDEVLDEMLLIYMPAELAGTCSCIKELKSNEQLWNLRYLYFIEAKGQKYVHYDYMELETELGARLKFLSGFKSRWKAVELRSIFRGIDSTENGKYLTVSDMLLRKFRKYGQEYELKFVLPNK